jgi:hypothetical protein
LFLNIYVFGYLDSEPEAYQEEILKTVYKNTIFLIFINLAYLSKGYWNLNPMTHTTEKNENV